MLDRQREGYWRIDKLGHKEPNTSEPPMWATGIGPAPTEYLRQRHMDLVPYPSCAVAGLGKAGGIHFAF